MKHFLLQYLNGRIERISVKDWARANHWNFPNHNFENANTTPTSEQIDSYLQNHGCVREVFNEDNYCYNPNDITEKDLITWKSTKSTVLNTYPNTKNNEVNATDNKITRKKNIKKNSSILVNSHSLDDLTKKFNIVDFEFNNENDLVKLNDKSLEEIKQIEGKLPEIPPFEKHPYLTQLKPSNKISGLMIGTFPPISYLCDQLSVPNLTFNGINDCSPLTPYFHGNKNSLWEYTSLDLISINKEKRSKRPDIIKNMLNDKGVIYTDIIKYCQRELDNSKGILKYTASDTLLNNIVLNNEIFDFIFLNESISKIYFTNSTFFSATNTKLFNSINKFDLSSRNAFVLFLKGAQDFGYLIDVCFPNNLEQWININERDRSKNEKNQVNAILSNKVYVKLKLSKSDKTRIFDVCSALSPAAVNRGSVRANLCVREYSNLKNELIESSPEGLLRTVLEYFFTNKMKELDSFNVY